MASYIVLVNFTDQGIRTVNESPKRYEAFKTLAERLEVQVKSVYWTVGKYDIVTTLEGKLTIEISGQETTVDLSQTVKTLVKTSDTNPAQPKRAAP